MFLDDKLYKIGSSMDKYSQNRDEIIAEMFIACADYLNDPESNYGVLLKRMLTHWENAVQKLNKQGYHFIHINTMKEFLASNRDTSEILKKLYQ